MIENTISEIEARLRQDKTVDDAKKQELLALLNRLKSEVSILSKTNKEDASSIASFAQISTNEAIRIKPNSKLIEISVAGLRSSVDGFEKTHPQLVEIVNRISNTLSNLGI